MQAIKEKIHDMKDMRKAKAEAKEEEKEEKELAKARLEVAKEVRLAREAEAEMDVHVKKAIEKAAKHEGTINYTNHDATGEICGGFTSDDTSGHFSGGHISNRDMGPFNEEGHSGKHDRDMGDVYSTPTNSFSTTTGGPPTSGLL